MKTVYNLYNNEQQDQYIGKIQWYTNGDHGIEWEESLLREYFSCETLQECFTEIRKHYGNQIYLLMQPYHPKSVPHTP